MTTVDANIQSEDGNYRVALGGGLCVQAASFAGLIRRAIDDGTAEGEYEASWVDGTVTGAVLLDMLTGLGDVQSAPLRGVAYVSQADLLKGVVPDRMYAVSAAEG